MTLKKYDFTIKKAKPGKPYTQQAGRKAGKGAGKIVAKESKIIEAAKLGKKAFHDGKKRVPVHDPELMKLLTGLQIGEGKPIMQAWISEWDRANLGGGIAVAGHDREKYPQYNAEQKKK